MTSDQLAEPRTVSRRSDAPNLSRGDPPAVRRAVILAAGMGNRLHTLTTDAPKCLVEIGGEPLLERALRALAS
ncbi:MAG: NTP transferase domain-containing protein, partial [Pseudomonadales bacterium]